MTQCPCSLARRLWQHRKIALITAATNVEIYGMFTENLFAKYSSQVQSFMTDALMFMNRVR